MTGSDDCTKWEPMLHGFLDGELDAAHSLQFEQHLAACEHCAAELRRFQDLKRLVGQKAARWRAPDHLRAQILNALVQEDAAAALPKVTAPPATGPRFFGLYQFVRQWSFVPSLAALAACLFLVFGPLRDGGDTLPNELVSSHIRSLLADHLTDVTTSDRHTVKPWFNGRIDFSPPVADLAPEGFPLVGGRVDYIGGRVVAALVYRRHGHVINIFVWPSPSARGATTKDGYNLVTWSRDGLNFSAVSDASVDDLRRLRDQFIEQTPK